MNKSVIHLLCAVMSFLIILVGSLFAYRFGLNIHLSTSAIVALISSAIVFISLSPNIRSQVRHICCDLDWADETIKFYNRIPVLYRRSFWIIFGFINLAFLFHTINFLWGNQDWSAIRYSTSLSDGLSEGRFSAYWLQELLFDGKILPVINNLWSFAGLSLASVLLCVYWSLPQTRSSYIITGLFFAITPYTLSWLYFAKNTLGNLWLPAIILSALILSEKKSENLNRSYTNNLLAIILFIISFGTYLPVINFIGVAILGKIFLSNSFSDTTIKKSFQQMLQPFANITAGLLIYIFIIIILKDTGIMKDNYNTVLTPLSDLPTKIPALFSAIFSQFIIPLPFIDPTYKVFALILTLTGLFALIFKTPNTKYAIRGLSIIPLILISSKLAFFFSVPSIENPVHVARIDFYSLPLLYTLFLATILHFESIYLKRFAFTLATLLIFMSFTRVSYAQKVWKFGWEAETKLAERIITRLEKHPDFNINRQYKLLQIGEHSMRHKYYLASKGENPSGELLSWSWYPSGNAKDAYNFYYQTDFLSADASIETASTNPMITEYLLNRARAWPAKESIYITGEYIVLVLDEKALSLAQIALLKK